MELRENPVKPMHRALCSAFPNVNTLRLLVATELAESMTTIAWETNVDTIVLELIQWATSHGMLEELIERAYRQNPRNPELRTFAEAFLGRPMRGTLSGGLVLESISDSEITKPLMEQPETPRSEVLREVRPPTRHNPYNAAQPADKEIFVGRFDLKRALTEGLQRGLSFSLAGEAGMGKTSLLHAVQRELSENDPVHGSLPLPIYLDFAAETYQAVDTVFLAIIDGLLQELGAQHRLECPEAIVRKAKRAAKQGRIAEALGLVLNWSFECQQRTHLPILLMDDLHRMKRSPWLAEMASILQKSVNQHQLALVLTGKNALVDELRNDVSPLRLLLTQHFTLKPLTYPETCILVQKASRYGWEIEDGCSELAYKITGGHPYRLHYYLYNVLAFTQKLGLAYLQSLRQDTELDRYLDTVLQDRTESS